MNTLRKTNVKGFYKDSKTGAVVNTDQTGLDAIKTRRKQLKQSRSDIDDLRREMCELKKEVEDLRREMRELKKEVEDIRYRIWFPDE